MSSYDQLLQKLDAFIRKYYKNQVIKGSLISSGIILASYLTLTILEYFGRFGSNVRFVLFFTEIVSVSAIVSYYILLPIFRMYNIGKQISHTEAAGIIGTHFEPVRDKLLNVLQLKELSDNNTDNSLLLAGIEQKTLELSPIPFSNAIDLSLNRRYLKFALPPLLVILTVLLVYPKLLTAPTKRIVEFNKEFKPEAPFTYHLDTKNLTVIENESFTLQVKTEGEELPEEVFIQYDGRQYRMEKLKPNEFRYTFPLVRKSEKFTFKSNEFESDSYTLTAIPRPSLLMMSADLEYPAYTGRRNERIANAGDLTVPEGTRILWKMNTRNTDILSVILLDSVYTLTSGNQYFEVLRKVKSNFDYSISAANKQISSPDTIRYSVQVIPDQFPQISVNEIQDSIRRSVRFFTGNITDDYGFKKLTFNYRITDHGKDRNEFISVPVQSNQLRQGFYYAYNFSDLNLQPGQEVVYYFTVFDNDGVNGSKTATSERRTYRMPTLDELSKQNEANAEAVKEELNESISRTTQMQKDMNNLTKNLLQKKNLDWQDKKKIEDLMKKQEDLKKQLEELKKQNEKNNLQKNEFSKQDQEMLEKQKKLEELMDKLMNDDLKKMMEQLRQMMENMDKNQLKDQLNEMKFSAEDMQKQLERTLELFKQLEFEQKLQENIDKLDKLAEQQEKLSEKSDDKKQDTNELNKEQEDLNKQFEEFRKDMDKLREKNEELEKKNEELKDTRPEEQQISEEQKNASEQLNKEQNKKASQSQKSAAQQMQQMSKDMKGMQQQMEEDNNSEDMATIRQLLENLLKLSFDQEAVIKELAVVQRNSPRLRELAQQERKLKDDARIIEDSLFALSKRQPMLDAMINKEVSTIKRNMEQAVENMGEREKERAMTHQQYAMTSMNNLALMLSESLQNMQMQMQMKAQGSASCKKPGSTNPQSGDMKSLQEMQKKLSEQMKKMAEQMKNQKDGQKPGEQKNGQMPGQGGTMSKEIAQMAAQQEMIRNKLKEMSEKLGKNGQRKELNEIMNKMEENETDLYNRRLTEQTMMRQKEIMSRLLESEKALREQDEDEKRESKEGVDIDKINPAILEKFKQDRAKEAELLRTIPPGLMPYYRKKLSEYLAN